MGLFEANMLFRCTFGTWCGNFGDNPTQYQPIDLFKEGDSLGKNRDNNGWSEFNTFGTNANCCSLESWWGDKNPLSLLDILHCQNNAN
jgi:hypothetical protein